MKTLIARIEELERHLFGPRLDWGMIYDTVKAMDATMNPPDPENADDDFDREFVERNGTREEFIETKRRASKS
jgi:hypothetical protein